MHGSNSFYSFKIAVLWQRNTGWKKAIEMPAVSEFEV